MFVFLSKLLPPFIYPVGLCFLTLILAWIFIRKSGWHKLFLILALLALLLGGNRWVAMGLVRSLEWKYLPTAKLPPMDVIVVLGGATHSANYPRQMVEVNGAGDRIFYAYWLFKQAVAPYILLSGANIEWLSADTQPAEDMATMLEMMGVPSEALWLEKDSLNTYQNALYSNRFLETKHINRIILVTSAIHMPRSVGVFEKQGLEVIPAPTDFTVTQANWEQIVHPRLETLVVNLIPSADNLAITTKALKEYLGIIVYSLRGWM
jgi:uncharacterized SAM-binding protein YcdF (DUF218 family)